MCVQTGAVALCSSTRDASGRSDYFFYFGLKCGPYAMLRPTPPMAKTMNDALLFHCCLDPGSAASESDLWKSGRPFGRSAIAASGSVAAVFKEASKRSPQVPGNPNINHD